jgi:hypothetical protein
MAESETETYDVMISYAWEHKEMVLKIREKLKERGFRCWIDVENMTGSILEAMSAAVENSSIFLMCYSEKYSESENCQSGKIIFQFFEGTNSYIRSFFRHRCTVIPVTSTRLDYSVEW